MRTLSLVIALGLAASGLAATCPWSPPAYAQKLTKPVKKELKAARAAEKAKNQTALNDNKKKLTTEKNAIPKALKEETAATKEQNVARAAYYAAKLAADRNPGNPTAEAQKVTTRSAYDEKINALKKKTDAVRDAYNNYIGTDNQRRVLKTERNLLKSEGLEEFAARKGIKPAELVAAPAAAQAVAAAGGAGAPALVEMKFNVVAAAPLRPVPAAQGAGNGGQPVISGAQLYLAPRRPQPAGPVPAPRGNLQAQAAMQAARAQAGQAPPVPVRRPLPPADVTQYVAAPPL